MVINKLKINGFKNLEGLKPTVSCNMLGENHPLAHPRRKAQPLQAQPWGRAQCHGLNLEEEPDPHGLNLGEKVNIYGFNYILDPTLRTLLGVNKIS